MQFVRAKVRKILEVLFHRAQVAARIGAGQPARETQLARRGGRAAQERHQRAHGVLPARAEALPNIGSFLQQREHKTAGVMRARVVTRTAAGRQAQSAALQRRGEPLEPSEQWLLRFYAYGAAGQACERDLRIGEELQRMKAARLRTLVRRGSERRYFCRAARVDHGHPLPPLDARCDRGNRIVGDGDENQIRAIGDVLRLRARPATGYPDGQLFGRIQTAAGGSDDLVPALRQAPGEALGDAARADEADTKRNLILLLHVVHLTQ